MLKVAALAVVVVTGAGMMTACSGGDYCGELRTYAEAVKGLDIKDTAAVDRMRGEAEKVSKSAPDELKDDWKIVLDYAKKAKEANGDQAKLAELAKADGAKIGPASEAIAKHAEDTCKIKIDNA